MQREREREEGEEEEEEETKKKQNVVNCWSSQHWPLLRRNRRALEIDLRSGRATFLCGLLCQGPAETWKRGHDVKRKLERAEAVMSMISWWELREAGRIERLKVAQHRRDRTWGERRRLGCRRSHHLTRVGRWVNRR